MGYTVIAPIGPDTKPFLVGMKEFPTERAILIAPTNYLKEAEKLSKKLEEFTIPVKIIDVKGNVLEQMFRTFGELCKTYDNDDLIVNLATGDQISTCAALSAAYANGIKAFGVMGGTTMIMPIMKLSYYNELNESKLNILKHLDHMNYISLKDLSKKLGMSVSLLSYHLNGNYKYKGLKDFRTVDLKEDGKNLYVKLSEMGHLLLKGYIGQDNKKE
jgi:hypothetical protein